MDESGDIIGIGHAGHAPQERHTMITTDRWDELFEIANHERPMEPLTDEETVELRNITQTLAAIDSAWMINGKPATLDKVRQTWEQIQEDMDRFARQEDEWLRRLGLPPIKR